MTYWTEDDFNVFTIEGLENRMTALQQQIQPKFRELGELYSATLSAHGLGEFHPHVAKHARRTVNPPSDSWVAFAPSKRGYKALPHFQIGLWDDRLFITLVVIYENTKKREISEALTKHPEVITNLPGHFIMSGDHTKKPSDSLQSLGESGIKALITRLHDVKSAELVIGVSLTAKEACQLSKTQFFDLVHKTFEQLMPLYRLYINTP